jgi:predicted DNA-binding transcriptional regulator AlpA
MRPPLAGAGKAVRQQRLFGARDAAHYLGISVSFFRALVADGSLPRPKRLGGRLLWDVLDLDCAADSLPYDGVANGHDAGTDTFADWAP